MTHSRRTLFESRGVAVVDFRCRAHVEPIGPEEPNAAHSIVFVRGGVFRLARRGRSLLADSSHVLFFNAGEEHRYAHPLPGGDACTILVVDAARALELAERHSPRDTDRPESPFGRADALSTPAMARRHYELLALVGAAAPALAVEDAVAELADAAMAAAHSSRRRPASPRHRELVEAARLAIHEHDASLPSLGELADRLGCSPFHLSRTFHATAGVSLRAYALRLRARRAACELAAGAADLTRLALELGYADHSHFTNGFRQEWGVPPSQFRARHARNIFQARGRTGI